MIRHYLRIISKRRWVIASVALVCLLLGMAYGLLAQRQYAATVTLEIARQADRIISTTGNDEQQRPSFDPEFYQTQYALIQSRSIAEAVVRDLHLGNNIAFLTDNAGDADGRMAGLSREQRERSAVQKVIANLQVIPVRLSSVVLVRFVSPDPNLAAAVANSVARNVIRSNLARRYEASSYARQFLEARLGEVRQRLELSERQAVAYAGQNQIINLNPINTGPRQAGQAEQSLQVATLSAANAALAEAASARIAAQNRFQQNAAASDATLTNVALNQLQQERGLREGERNRLLGTFGPEYPQVRALTAQVASLDRQIATEASRIRGSVRQMLEAQYHEALATEREQQARVTDLQNQVLEQRRRGIQYNIYQRDVDTNRELYEALLQRYKEIGVTGGIGTNNISVVDPATVPQGPFRPNVPLTLIMSLILGLALGAGAAMLLEQLDEAAILPADFQSKLGIPLLGSIPRLAKGEAALDVLTDRKAPMSEAYISVLTALHFSTSRGTPKTILITSTRASEGKSTTAYALAQGLARVGGSILLIDADMRNPSIHKVMSLPNKEGLSSLLVGDGTLETLVRPSGMPNLSVLTAGRLPPNAAELLSGNDLHKAIADASAKFTHVVVDGPPILGLADAPLLARAVDATIFVLEAGQTRATQARHALHRLLAVRAMVVGAVLTKFDMQKSGYGYGYGYDYSYGQ